MHRRATDAAPLAIFIVVFCIAMFVLTGVAFALDWRIST